MTPLDNCILRIASLRKLDTNPEQEIGCQELWDMVNAKCNQIEALQPQLHLHSQGITSFDDVPELK